MSDLISKSALLASTDKEEIHKYEIALFPTIDAVPVVRCRDCEFWGTHFRTVGGKYGDCLNLERGTRADFYCGWGSRSDECSD